MRDMDKVTLFVGESCAPCGAAKKFLQQHNIEFEEVVVQSVHEQLIRTRNGGKFGVPTLHYDNQFVIGFSIPRYRELLRL